MPEEEQQYIEKYCPMCKKERVFVTSLSPSGYIICCACGYRESIKPIEIIQNDFGFRVVNKGGKK